jgi:hypothetical protein
MISAFAVFALSESFNIVCDDEIAIKYAHVMFESFAKRGDGPFKSVEVFEEFEPKVSFREGVYFANLVPKGDQADILYPMFEIAFSRWDGAWLGGRTTSADFKWPQRMINLNRNRLKQLFPK